MDSSAAGLHLAFPCRPDLATQTLPAPGGRSVAMGLLSCEQQGQRFSVSWVDLDDPRRVPEALAAVRQAFSDKLHRAPERRRPFEVAGATPHEQALQWELRAQPGPAQGEAFAAVASFAYGLRVYQVTLLGGSDWEQAREHWLHFGGALRVLPRS
ncbi:hypothetical protein ACG0Z6_07285 [Roseateles sp. BYS180W]|uniref:DUF1795 domain-containing protein n=1 Tax=Roseateles rivi TaxID=3299028 RepID=A0ABW7FUP9_9BURK